MAGVLGVFQPCDDGLGRAGAFGEFLLGQLRGVAHLAHQQIEVDLAQRPQECAAVARAAAHLSLDNLALDNFSVHIAIHGCTSLSRASRFCF
ncbi:MAG: hypothetical protein ACRD5F_09375 [Candidatus Acidiferrales bacterium]